MKTFEITLFIETGTLDDHEETLCAVFDDGTPTQLGDGTLFVEIMREAESLPHALLSVAEDALANIAKLGRVRFAASEVVPVSAIAKELGISRDTVYKHARGDRGDGFPAPVSTNGVTIYSLNDIRKYFAERGLCAAPEATKEAAAIVTLVQPILNLAADWAATGDAEAMSDVIDLFGRARKRALAA